MKLIYKKLLILAGSAGALFAGTHYISLNFKQDSIESGGNTKVIKIFIAAKQPSNKGTA